MPPCAHFNPQNNQISRRCRWEPHNQSNTNDFPRSTSFDQGWPEEELWESLLVGRTDPSMLKKLIYALQWLLVEGASTSSLIGERKVPL